MSTAMPAGHLARGVAAHAVGHDGQPLGPGQEKRVLVVLAFHSDVGVARETDPQAVEREGGAHRFDHRIVRSRHYQTAGHLQYSPTSPHVSDATHRRPREALARRILIIDGAMGTVVQRHQLTEADFRGDRFAAHPRDLKGDNEVLGAHPTRRHRLHPRRIFCGRGRHRRDQHLRRHRHRPGRLRSGGAGLRAEPRGRPPGPGRGRGVVRAHARPPPFRGRRHGPHQQDPVALAGRERPGFPGGYVRSGEGRLRRAGPGSDRRRRRSAAVRDLHRHAEPQGRAGGGGGGVRGEGAAAAADDLDHRHRPQRPHPVRADHRGIPHLHRARPPAVGRHQLRPGRARDAALRGGAVGPVQRPRQLLPERGLAQRLRRIRRDPGGHLRPHPRAGRERLREPGRWVLRYHPRPHRRHRRRGRGHPPAQAPPPPAKAACGCRVWSGWRSRPSRTSS